MAGHDVMETNRMAPKTSARERAPRSFWFDPRFAVGILLVAASVGGVFVVVSSADDTTTVYAARSSLTVGDRISADDLVEQSVRLGVVTEKYLGGELPDDGLIVTRTIAEGELVPVSAVGSAAGERMASVVVTLRSQLPKAVVAGTVVDIWAGREGDSGLFGPPSVLVPSATVVRVIESDGIIAGSATVDVELLVPRSRTARVLESLANSDALSLVPVSLPIAASARG